MKIGITFFSIWCFLYLFFVSGSLVLFDCTPTRRGGVVGSRHTKPASAGEVCTAVFCSRNGSALKSQTFLNSPRRLGLPRQRAVRRGSRLRPTPKTQSTARRGHNAVAVPFPGGILADAAENQRNSQSQTFLNSLRRLEPPRQRAARGAKRLKR